MACNIGDEIIYGYIFDELDELSTIIIDKHVVECDECRKKAEKCKDLDYELYLLKKEKIEIPAQLDHIYTHICSSQDKKSSFSLSRFISIQRKILKNQVSYIGFLPGSELGKSMAGKISKSMLKVSGALIKQGYKIALSRR